MKTWVLPFNRRNGFEWTIRSRSRWKGVRTPHSSSARGRPRVSYERTASGESQRSSCSRTRASKASATLPAISGIRPSLDDDRDSASVHAPGGARHETGKVRAQEGDHRCDLLRLRKPAQRSAGGDAGEHLVAVALLVGEPALPQPRLRGRGAGRDGVAA